MSHTIKELSSFGINIPSDSEGTIEVNCPSCIGRRRKKDSKPLVVNVDEGRWRCHHCGWEGNISKGIIDYIKNPWRAGHKWRTPDDYLPAPLPESASKWLSERCIGKEVLKRNKIGWGRAWSPSSEAWTHTMQFPVFRDEKIINVKHRGKNKSFWTEPNAEKMLYGIDDINPENVIWTGGEIDKLSLEEAGYISVVSAPDGCPPPDVHEYGKYFEFLERVAKNLDSVCTFTLALPNDEAGKRMEEELARRLGKERCLRVQWPEGFRDANDVLVGAGKDVLRECIDGARQFPVKGIFEMIDVEDSFDILYDYGLKQGCTTGWDALDEFYRPAGGQWDLVTGIPGHGKSNFLDALLVNLSTIHGWKHAIFSPENQPIERHLAGLVEKWAGAPFDVGGTPRMTKEVKDAGKRWIQDHFSIILPDEEEGNWTIDGILALAKVLVYRKGIRGLVIDPWNELDHSRPAAMTETEHISKSLSKIRQFARKHDVHAWVVAHPAKMVKDANGKYPVPTPYNVAGSAHFRNKADGAISAYRNVGSDDESISDIWIQKVRFRENGKVGRVSLRYDWPSRRFIDDVNQDRRDQALTKDETHTLDWYLKH